MIGKTLGHFQIIQEIGSGGMGVVYKARDLHLDRFVALKILPPEQVSDVERKKRFVQEAKAASALNHSNIVHIYDISADAGVDFIAMEYVEGKTLDARIGRRGLQLKEVLKYGVQISDALAKAHSAGIIHRDLKPSNIMVNEDDTVKILDFGLAKLTEQIHGDELATTATAAAEEKPVTGKGTVVGTVAYMSPEQVEGKTVDTRSDIFSFGSVLYEMITGRRAFTGTNAFSTLSAILSKDPDPLSTEIPRDLDRIITRCLRKDPARRFQNMSDLKVVLEELKEESDSHEFASITSAGIAPSETRFPRKTSVFLAVLVIGVLAATWLYVRSRSNHDEGALPSRIALGGNLTLLVSSAGEASDPALSPDGKMLAFVAEVQGRKDLFVRRVAGGEGIRLTNDSAEEIFPSFSPDGERILFTRLGSEAKLLEICLIPTFGGQGVHVIENALHAAWSPDGRQLVFISRHPGEGDALCISEADGTNISTIMKADSAYPFFRTPSWSPDGKHLAVIRSLGGSSGELWLVPVDGSEPRRLSKDPPGVFSHRPVFTPNGQGLIHESNRAGATNLWMFPLDNGQPVRLTSGPGPDRVPSVARDGSVAFINARRQCALIIHDLANRQFREIFAHSSSIWAPAFSPTGRELAFSLSEQDGSWHIWITPVEGGAPRQLTSGTLPEVYPRFTPDGNSVIYQTWSSGADQIWRVPLSGGPPEPLTPAHSEDDQFCDVSPDGKRIAFSRTEKDGTRIYIALVDGSGIRKLTDFPSTLPRWSPDGQWIAFSRSREYRDGIYVIRTDGTDMRQLTESGCWPAWFPDGKRLGFQNLANDGSLVIQTVPVAGGPIQSLSSVKYNGTNHPFDVSPDGTMLATSDCEAISSDIWLLDPHQ